MTAAPPIRTLLRSAIDYAGLFPPAALPMAEAVRNYVEYRASPDAWALGRFVVPAARLVEFLGASARHPGRGWPISATLAADASADLARIAALEPRLVAAGAAVEVVEARTPDPATVEVIAGAVGARIWYGEVPLGPQRDAVLDALAGRGARAKIRMGGVTPDAFPDAALVAGFLVAVTARQLPFKATAGLHHPVGGRYRLSYEPDAPSGTMFGYLNLAFAAALAAGGADEASVAAALRGGDVPPTVKDTGLAWAGRHIDAAAVDRLRVVFDGFGSCSFREPLDELEMMLP